MSRRRPLCVAAFALALVACRGREVTVFETTLAAGSSGAAGALLSGGSAGSSPSVGDGGDGMAGGGVSGMAGMVQGGAASGGTAGSDDLAGASGGPPGKPCGNNDDCEGWFCEKVGCDAPTGVCQPPPAFPPPEPEPVCGCDGVTYWNDDIRRWFGKSLASPGECRATARACEVGSDCEVPYASCSHLVSPGEVCNYGTGTCWVLPPSCADTGDPMIWRLCRPSDAEPPPPCVDTCLAIRSERPHAVPFRDECK